IDCPRVRALGRRSTQDARRDKNRRRLRHPGCDRGRHLFLGETPLMTHLLLAAAVLTMRVDYYHTGNVGQEHFSLDRVVVEPLPWPGDPQKNIDTTRRGKYFFEVID